MSRWQEREREEGEEACLGGRPFTMSSIAGEVKKDKGHGATVFGQQTVTVTLRTCFHRITGAGVSG